MYEQAMIRRGGAEGFGAYRYHKGLRVLPITELVRRVPDLAGVAGTVPIGCSCGSRTRLTRSTTTSIRT